VSWLKRKIGKFVGQSEATANPRAPDGLRLYAVGDIHGRADLLNRLLDKISADIADIGDVEVHLLFLGDYVDRGPDSRLVLETLRRLKLNGGDRVITLKGNHEEAFLGFIDDPTTGPAWAEHGGRETLLSYGVVTPKLRTDAEGWTRARDEFVAAVPADHIRFLKSLHLWEKVGDYVFVHAGVRPGVPLEDQQERDLLWIRDEFLQSDRAMENVVVHGHTPGERPALAKGRIGIDTGAYATGVLTALKLQGENRAFLQTGA
jgi:serine/threonine protein phosphatase 1